MISEYMQGVREQIKSGEINETILESDVLCPYCGERLPTEEDSEMFVDGAYDRECDECGRAFKVDVSVSVYYSTSRIE